MHRSDLLNLPVGLFGFATISENNMLYVDKTDLLLKLVRKPGWYFISRPRRFGKSLMISTLEAMFVGKTQLFRGLAAEKWVVRQAQCPTPVNPFGYECRQLR